jgi:hypothetical protein
VGIYINKGGFAMTSVTKQIVEMIDMLPENEQQLACELLKRLVLAWDPDFSKVTPLEEQRIGAALQAAEKDETVSHDEVNWK